MHGAIVIVQRGTTWFSITLLPVCLELDSLAAHQTSIGPCPGIVFHNQQRV